MPSIRLVSTGHHVPDYSVVGVCSTTPRDFVSHVALVRQSDQLCYGEKAKVYHMRPPLIGPDALKTVLHCLGEIQAHVFGCLSSLHRNEFDGIKTWLSRIEKQVKQPIPYGRRGSLREFCRLQYIVSPPFTDWVKDDGTGVPRYRRFSCAGFVLACYDEGAGIVLLDWQADDFPKVDINTLNIAYNHILGELDPQDMAWFGKLNEGPWPKPIILAGYILHSW